MKRIGYSLLAILLCLALLLPLYASAEEDQAEPLLDPAALQQMVESYLTEHKLNPEQISIGYVYTATGETWYYNENEWMFSASTYKVPLMMLLAQLEYQGELTQDSDVKGLKLSRAEELVLTYSHNDYAHLMESYFGGEKECLKLYKQFSDLPDEDYDPDYMEWRDFSARFLTGVMKTLYYEEERFPNIIDCLKAANHDMYFHGVWGGEYEVAQKYGSLMNNYTYVNHTMGIVYMPHPFILTVMTENVVGYHPVIQDICRLFGEYTLSLEEPLAEREAEAARRAAEEAEKAAEEERRKAEEETVQASPAPEGTIAPAEKTPAAETPTPDPGLEGETGESRLPRGLLLGLAGAAVLAMIPLYLKQRARKRVGQRR